MGCGIPVGGAVDFLTAIARGLCDLWVLSLLAGGFFGELGTGPMVVVRDVCGLLRDGDRLKLWE